jgi:hypothetical protein
MSRFRLLLLLVPCLLALLMVGQSGIGGAQPVPTPIGHLGGPVPLTPEELLDTPTPAPTPTEATPENAEGPAGCTVAPLTPDEAIARIGQVDASAGSAPTFESNPDPNDAAVATLRTFVACLNAGDYLRIAAITTPEFFARLVAGTGWETDEIPTKLSTPHPRDPDLYLRIVEIGSVLDQTGGEAALTVVLLDPASPFLGETEYGARFVREGDAWLQADLKTIS